MGRLHTRFQDAGISRLEDPAVDSGDRAHLLRVKELFPFVDPIEATAIINSTSAESLISFFLYFRSR